MNTNITGEAVKHEPGIQDEMFMALVAYRCSGVMACTTYIEERNMDRRKTGLCILVLPQSASGNVSDSICPNC